MSGIAASIVVNRLRNKPWYSAPVTAANVPDRYPHPDLLQGNERWVFGDSACASQKALMRRKAPKAKDFTRQRVKRNGEVDEKIEAKNCTKARVRAPVEHVLGVVERLRGFGKVGYRCLQRNATRVFTGSGTGQHLLGAQDLDGPGAPMKEGIGP